MPLNLKGRDPDQQRSQTPQGHANAPQGHANAFQGTVGHQPMGRASGALQSPPRPVQPAVAPVAPRAQLDSPPIAPQAQPQPAQAADPFGQPFAPGPDRTSAADKAASVLKRSASVALSDDDRELLCGLAALQIRYARHEEAVAFLMKVHRDTPHDAQAARLLATALVKLNRFEEAEIVLHNGNVAGTGSAAGFLLHSLIALKTRGLSEARDWFARFVGAKGGRA